MKKILFATDFSESSKKAFTYALEFAKGANSELVMVNVFQGPSAFKYPYNEYTLADEERELREAKEKLSKLFDSCNTSENSFDQISYAVIKHPSAVSGIIDFAEKEGTDLILMSALGDNLSSEIVFGGITKNIIQKSPIPVITIPPDVKFAGCKNIVFSTNYYEGDILAIKEVIQLFQHFSPDITLVHVSEQTEEEDDRNEVFWRKVRQQIDYPKVNLRILSSDDVYSRLMEFLAGEEFNIHVMTSHEHASIFYRLFHADIIKKMEFNGKLPVLTFNEIGLSKIKSTDVDMQPDNRL